MAAKYKLIYKAEKKSKSKSAIIKDLGNNPYILTMSAQFWNLC